MSSIIQFRQLNQSSASASTSKPYYAQPVSAQLTEENLPLPSHLCVPGEQIASATTFMRGHGTFVADEQVVSSLVGKIGRVNKLISVHAIRSRYTPEVGDLVVGRITSVQAKRWKADIFAKQDAILMLSSINLPGGVQRRKLESDELQMRTFFQEGDLLVCEVQAFFGDGSVSLHTRSLKYGKLRNGLLSVVSPALIKRLQSHFIELECGVDVILGINGYIWVSAHTDSSLLNNENGEQEITEAVYSNVNEEILSNTRLCIARVQTLLRALSENEVEITEDTIRHGYEICVAHEEDWNSTEWREEVAMAAMKAVENIVY